MSTNSIFRAISCQHFRLLTIVWHLDDNQGPQFDKRLQQMFNFAEGRWLLWYIFFQFIYFMVGFDRIIWLVSSHMNLMGWLLAFHWDQVIPGIILCRRFSFVLPVRRYLEWFCEMHAMSPLCQKRNVSLRNVSLSKEKWRTSIHAMVCSIKQPLHARKIKIYEFVNSMKIWGGLCCYIPHCCLLPVLPFFTLFQMRVRAKSASMHCIYQSNIPTTPSHECEKCDLFF